MFRPSLSMFAKLVRKSAKGFNMLLLFMMSIGVPPQAPDLPQTPPLPQVVVEVTPYSQLLSRIHAGERVRVASGVPTPAGYEPIEIPGEVGLFECFLEAGKPMMRPMIRPMTASVFVPRIVNQEACFT